MTWIYLTCNIKFRIPETFEENLFDEPNFNLENLFWLLLIRKYLKENNVKYDKFIGNKPFYNCFIDDKTVNNLLHKHELKETIDES